MCLLDKERNCHCQKSWSYSRNERDHFSCFFVFCLKGAQIDCSVFSKHSIASEMQKVHKCMGFCPQFDALFDELTASEHLTLYARLRGVPEKELHKVRGL